MKHLLYGAAALALLSNAALALPVTAPAGSGVPFNNLQPSLAVTQLIVEQGVYPSRDPSGYATGGTMGFIDSFAGNFAPGGSFAAQGQLLPVIAHSPLFSITGYNFGSTNFNTFNLPDLRGRAMVGVGSGPNLTARNIGDSFGSPTVTLSESQMPAHDHGLPGGGTTGSTGGGQPFDNMQPSLALRPLIATTATLPSQGGGNPGAAFLGEVKYFAGDYDPAGWTVADGRLLSITQNEGLFALIGTTYGGDGVNTFALPDLRGRVAVGSNGSSLPLGTVFGQETETLLPSQMPAHDHGLPGGGTTDIAGGGYPVGNDQPSLAINYLISLTGIFPSASASPFDTTTPYIGEIVGWSGAFAPTGWAFADGQLLSIAQNQVLFAILGTMYGGDGVRNFALPDLRGRTMIGAGLFDGTTYNVGGVYGTDYNTLNVANLPPHVHTLPEPPPPVGDIPEPFSIALMLGGMMGLGALRRHSVRRRSSRE